jgi:GT2 family glycosyltransferase
VSDSEIIVVDNASTDGTREFLAARPGLRVMANDTNRGCGYAWNQGVEATAARWTVILNNDVVVAPGFREGLVGFAEETGCQIVSPARCDGELDYDFLDFAGRFVSTMQLACRRGVATGVAFMVHRNVFEAVGMFDARIGRAGYEDEDFSRHARKGGFRLAVTGRAYLHHFGSVTQKSVKSDMGLAESARLSDRDYFRKKHWLNWFRRRSDRLRDKLRTALWRWSERRRFGITLFLRRHGGAWHPG